MEGTTGRRKQDAQRPRRPNASRAGKTRTKTVRTAREAATSVVQSGPDNMAARWERPVARAALVGGRMARRRCTGTRGLAGKGADGPSGRRRRPGSATEKRGARVPRGARPQQGPPSDSKSYDDGPDFHARLFFFEPIGAAPAGTARRAGRTDAQNQGVRRPETHGPSTGGARPASQGAPPGARRQRARPGAPNPGRDGPAAGQGSAPATRRRFEAAEGPAAPGRPGSGSDHTTSPGESTRPGWAATDPTAGPAYYAAPRCRAPKRQPTRRAMDDPNRSTRQSPSANRPAPCRRGRGRGPRSGHRAVVGWLKLAFGIGWRGRDMTGCGG